MAAITGAWRCVLFEHDIYFQSIARGSANPRGWIEKAKAAYEYLRALRYELRVLPRFDRVQVCSAENGNYLLSFCAGPARADRRQPRGHRDVAV